MRLTEEQRSASPHTMNKATYYELHLDQLFMQLRLMSFDTENAMYDYKIQQDDSKQDDKT